MREKPTRVKIIEYNEHLPNKFSIMSIINVWFFEIKEWI